MKANQQLLHDSARAVATLAHSQPIPGIYELLQNAQRTFIKMADSMQQDIDKLHKQIQKLNEFDRQTKNLFATSLEEMQLAMQGILVLNEITVKSNGLYTLPSGVDKSYFTEIKKEASTVLETAKPKIELIKKTDSLEEISRKTIACANIGINPYTGKKISQKEANKFKYAAWAGTLTEVGNVVLGARAGKKAASRLDGLDDAGNVKQKEFSKKASGFNYLDDQLGNMKNNVKVNKYESAESINNWWKNQGYDQPPYTSKTVVQDLDLLADTKFVRVYDGTNSKLHGGWLMEVEAIKGLTPAQIQDKFSLPHLPKYVGEVMVPKGSSLRMGEVNPLFEHKGGGVQFDLKGQYIGDFKELGTIKEWSGLK
ncbi:hypothetical protein [Enterococcus faecalis]|uniref:hypothetical protein n=1 Tax=Enterococcus faecalis TaxID=1351 RepID=UPI0035C9DB25